MGAPRNPYSVFLFFCPVCGWSCVGGEFHRGYLHFPQMKRLGDRLVVSLKCPVCGRRSVRVICPVCQREYRVYDVVGVERKGRLWKLVVKCPDCGHREALEYAPVGFKKAKRGLVEKGHIYKIYKKM